MNRRQFLASAASVATVASLAENARAANDPPRPAKAAKPTGVGKDVDWHDVREWGVEGKAFNDTESYFDRLPARAKGVVRHEVWNLSHHTTGMAAYFESDATEFFVRYTLLNSDLAMNHMPATGVSGLDLYGMTDKGWRWLATHIPRAKTIEAKLVSQIAPGRRAYHLNLPLYNGVTSLEIGVPKGTAFVPTPPQKVKPILFYGTSITQGGCASRPGMSFTSILRRRLNVPVLNFGFSGNGRTELEVGRFLVEIDPAVFVLDTSANTAAENLGAKTEALVKLIRDHRADTPVLLLDGRELQGASLIAGMSERNRKQTASLKQAYENLKAANVQNIHFREGGDLIGEDQEGTVDGSHPTDLGMMRYADALEPDLRRLLGPA
jgi:lysophospholipase L1-like esterase